MEDTYTDNFQNLSLLQSSSWATPAHRLCVCLHTWQQRLCLALGHAGSVHYWLTQCDSHLWTWAPRFPTLSLFPPGTKGQQPDQFPDASFLFVRGISVSLLGIDTLCFLHLNISTRKTDSKSQRGQATSLDVLNKSKYLHSPKPHFTTVFPRDLKVCEFRTKQ